MITSSQNPLVKYLVRLNSQKSFRSVERLFLAEGILPVSEALRDLPVEMIEKVFLAPEILGADDTRNISARVREKNIPLEEMSSAVFKKISATESPQGVALLARQNQGKWTGVGDKKIILLLDNLQDPGNLGTILRTAEAAGVDQVILSENSVEPYNPKVIRSSMGSIFRLPVAPANLKTVIIDVKKSGGRVLATSSRKGAAYDKIDFTFPVGLVLGQESGGISPEIMKLADSTISIPLSGKVESINVAQSAAVLLFEIKKKLKK